jgi:hypothetical protein
MDKSQLTKLIAIVSTSAIYIEPNMEAVRINYWETDSELEAGVELDELCFYGTGEESGEEYRIPYTNIDLDADMFYELKLVDPRNF